LAHKHAVSVAEYADVFSVHPPRFLANVVKTGLRLAKDVIPLARDKLSRNLSRHLPRSRRKVTIGPARNGLTDKRADTLRDLFLDGGHGFAFFLGAPSRSRCMSPASQSQNLST